MLIISASKVIKKCMEKSVRKKLFISIIILLLTCVFYKNVNAKPINTKQILNKSVVQSTALEGDDYILTDNSMNPKLHYYYYIPSSLLQNKNLSYPLIVAVPGISGGGKGFVTQEMKDFAQKEGFGIVAPTFLADKNLWWDTQTCYTYPAAWSGDAMIKIVKDLKPKGFKYSKLYLFGFSAGAHFSAMFSLIHPEMTAACALNSSGARVWPETNNGVKYFITVGDKDDKHFIENAEIFYNAARKLNMTAEYKQYNEGHILCNQQIIDGLNFFKKVKNGQI